jgi:hemerythrin-like domain-containing protein
VAKRKRTSSTASKRSSARQARKRASARTSARRKTTRRSSAKRTAVTRKSAKRKTAARSAATRSRKTAKAKKSPSTLSSATTSVRGAIAGAVAVVTTRLAGDTDALALLERDHRRVKDLLKRGEDTTERAAQGRTALLDTLSAELTVHEMIEEKVLYPALKAHPEGKDLALEGYQEHHVADVLIKELHELAKDDERWGAKFKVLKENLEHHIEEEEGPMFRTARGLFSRDELQALGAQMMKMKAQAESSR